MPDPPDKLARASQMTRGGGVARPAGAGHRHAVQASLRARRRRWRFVSDRTCRSWYRACTMHVGLRLGCSGPERSAAAGGE